MLRPKKVGIWAEHGSALRSLFTVLNTDNSILSMP